MSTEHVIVSKNTFLNYNNQPKLSTRRSQTADLYAGHVSMEDPVYLVQELDKTPANYYREREIGSNPFRMKPDWSKHDSNCSDTTVDSGYRSSSSSLQTYISKRLSITSLRNSSSEFKCDGVPEEGEDDLRDPEVTKLDDFAETHQIPEENWTTVMIRHIPCRYSQDELMKEVEEMKMPFNFLYLPPARRSPGNLGYAFVNFVLPEDAKCFVEDFKGHAFVCQPKSKKRAVVMFAKLQGFMQNVEFYSGVKVSKSKHRPFIDRRYLDCMESA